MDFVPFALERWQSTWENRVRYNLSESGVHPMTARALLRLAGAADAAALDAPLGYPQSNGTAPLRERIAALYPGATPDHVLVTSGSAEANYVNCWTLIQPGDHVAIVTPNYMQTWGLARNFGARITEIPLRESLGWQPDPADIDRAVVPGTRLVVVTNPSNPTGAVLAPELARRIAARGAAVGAWLLADEVYQGAERDAHLTPSFWGTGERVIVTNGLSKAYGLPGLRIGWCVAPPEHVAALWARKDYTTIGPAVMSDALAALALHPAVRPRIFERTRGIIRHNWGIVERWLAGLGGELSFRAPDAGAIVYARYRADVNSSDFAEALRRDHDVLIVPGDQFAMDRYVRLGFGPEPAVLEAALAKVATAYRREAAA
jgi:aspartate/methionine/tyrosine aminotransferase